MHKRSKGGGKWDKTLNLVGLVMQSITKLDVPGMQNMKAISRRTRGLKVTYSTYLTGLRLINLHVIVLFEISIPWMGKRSIQFF